MPRRWRDGRVRASTHPTTHGNHRWPDRLACHRNLRPRPKGAWHASRRHVRRSREVLNDGRSATVGTDGRMGRNRPQGWRCSTAAETGPRQLVRGGASQKGPKCRFLEPRALTAPTFPIMLSMGVVARPQRRLVHLGEVAPGNAKTKPKGGVIRIAAGRDGVRFPPAVTDSKAHLRRFRSSAGLVPGGIGFDNIDNNATCEFMGLPPSAARGGGRGQSRPIPVVPMPSVFFCPSTA